MIEWDECYDEATERMPREQRRKYLEARVRETVSLAYQEAPGIRRILDRAGIVPSAIQSLEDLDRVPVTRKDDLVKLQKEDPPFGGFTTVPLHSLKKVFLSPGPIYDPEGSEGFARRTAKALFAAGFRKGDIVLNSGSYQLVPGPLLIDEALDYLGITVIPAGTGNTELQVQMMRDLGVTAYASFSSFLLTLIKKAEEMGYNFRRDFKLTHTLHSAEPLPDSLRRTLEDGYGINITQAYGSADTWLVAYECSRKAGMHIVDDMFLEIVDPNTGKRQGPGEIGEVVVTMFNKVYPLVRFGTGDLSYYADEPCPCGRTSDRLVRIMGRIGDAVKVRGLFLHGREVEAVVAKFPDVSSFQAVVTRSGARDELTLKLELANEATDRGKLAERVGEGVKEACQLKVDRVEFLVKGTLPEGRKRIVDQRKWD